MALIALIAQTQEDLPAFYSTIDRYSGRGAEIAQVPQANLSSLPSVETPQAAPVAQHVAQASNDAAAGAREAKRFYADVAQAIGVDRLASQQKGIAKTMRQQGATVAQVAQALGGQQVAQVAAPVAQVTPQAQQSQDAIASLEAQLAALKQAQVPQAPVAQAAPQAAQLTMVPPFHLLTPAQQAAMVEWAGTFVMPTRKAALQNYIAGSGHWQDAVAAGVDQRKALKRLNNV